MPDGRHYDPHVERKLVGAALLEEVPLEEHAGSSEKLGQSSSACSHLRPEYLVVSQPIEYQSPFRQRRQLIGQLPLLYPTVFDNRRTD
jgi:hypothetical protein